MTSLIEVLAERVVGTVEEVRSDSITVRLELDAPQATALNTGSPGGFPRLNGYVLVPNEVGATVGMISAVRVERLPFPKRTGTQDLGLVDLPFPSRVMSLTPLGTLTARRTDPQLSFEVRRGVDVFPSVGDPVLLPTLDQLRAIVEGEKKETAGRILLGRCPTAGRALVFADPDKLFGRHLAVLGNTGAGKSCSVAGLIRWSLAAASKVRKESSRDGTPNARFIVLDPNGEYARAFGDLGIRLFQVAPTGSGRALKVPAWLWNGEEWAAFAGAAPGVQRPLLFDAIRRLKAGSGAPDTFQIRVSGRVKRSRMRISAALKGGEHQGFPKRESFAATLANVKTDMEAEYAGECTDGDLRDKLEAAAARAQEARQGAFAYKDKHTGAERHNDFSEESVDRVIAALGEVAVAVGLREDEVVPGEDTPLYFEVNDLPGFVDALATDTSGRDLAQFVDSLNLRIRSLLVRGSLASVLRPDDAAALTLEAWLTEHIGANGASNGPIAVVDLSLVPSDVIHVVVAVLARMVFEAVQRHRRLKGEELPTALVLEEAHTFIHRDLAGEGAFPAGRVCYRVFERIAREGRKFGLGLVLASQRPSEMSPTVLSQCNTFLLHRIVNDRDQELVRHLVPEGLGSLLRELPSLPSRRAVLLGWAAPAPILVEMEELPEAARPHSPDPSFWDVWTGTKDRKIDWSAVARRWAGGTGTDSAGGEERAAAQPEPKPVDGPEGK